MYAINYHKYAAVLLKILLVFLGFSKQTAMMCVCVCVCVCVCTHMYVNEFQHFITDYGRVILYYH